MKQVYDILKFSAGAFVWAIMVGIVLLVIFGEVARTIFFIKWGLGF